MARKIKPTPLENISVLRRFSLLFFIMSILPALIIATFYTYLHEIGVMNNVIILIPLLAIYFSVGYWGMRLVLKDLVSLVRIHSDTLEHLLGPEKMKEITRGNNELAVLARTFDEVVGRLEENVRQLEFTKRTLHSVLNKIGKGLSSFDDIDNFLNLILETIANALNSDKGILLIREGKENEFEVKSVYGVFLEDLPTTQITVNAGRIHSILESHKPAIVTGRGGDQTPAELQELLFNPPLICAPLVSHDVNYGLVVISRTSGRDFNREELDLFFNIVLQTAVAVENSKLSENAEKIYFETMSALALAVEAKDPYSRGHLDRVADLSMKIGYRLSLSQEEISTLRDASKLHDIGKIGVLDEILRKPGKLTDEEMDIMKKHVVIGEGIISPIRSLRRVCEMVRHHHERLDGSGYPDGLKGDDINFLTRVLSVADIYDSLTSTRPYRKALTREEARRIMKEEFADKLDQNIVNTLFSVTS